MTRPEGSDATPEAADRCMRVLIAITRGEAGGAQGHVRELVAGLSGRVDFLVGIGEEGWLPRELRALGVPVHVLPSLERALGRHDLGALGELRALIRESAPDLVHTHSSKAGVLGRLAARLEGLPSLHTAHAWSFSEGQPRTRVLASLPPEALIGRITNRVIAVSEADRALALRYRVAGDEQLRVVHNGVPDHPARAAPRAGDPPVITMVARFAPPKDHVLLLEALAALEAPWRLRLVGDGEDRPAIEERLRALEIEDRVELLGAREDVAELHASSQVAALVSRQEGFPLVVLEAMRAGLPVIASDVGGIREAVTPETGALVPRGDRAALTGALEALLTDPGRRAAQGAAGRARYEERFTAARMVAGTAAVYDELARDHALPRVCA